ncbi:MAG: CBS domain-containing protein [Planctomycetales bacterium]|nr:CBS domain-containing protein [Planctomycetales bacterium]
MFVRDWMTAHPVTIGEETTLGEARWLLKAHRVGRLPVVRGGRLVGMVTERELGEAAPSSVDLTSPDEYREGIESTRVGVLMARDPATVAPGDTIESAAGRMLERRVGELPVVERGRLVGILTETDVCRVLSHILAVQGPRTRMVLQTGNSDPPLWEQLQLLAGHGLRVASVTCYRSRPGGESLAVVTTGPGRQVGAGA